MHTCALSERVIWGWVEVEEGEGGGQEEGRRWVGGEGIGRTVDKNGRGKETCPASLSKFGSWNWSPCPSRTLRRMGAVSQELTPSKPVLAESA